MDFRQLKSASKNSLEFLTDELAKISSQESGRKADERFWSPTVDKTGNGFAIIRFLPAPPNEDVPFVRMFDHGFQGPGGWYIENSLTTIGQPDPVSELNSRLWNSSTDDKGPEREQARKQKRRLHYISNIYVIRDPSNPDTEGKVWLFKYGKKIFNHLSRLMEPEFEDEVAVNPFDLWTGANFRLKIQRVDGYRNYDRCEFDKPAAPLFNDDEKLEIIWNSEHSLKAFLAPSNFKTYDELKAKLVRVLSVPTDPMAPTPSTKEELPWDEAPQIRTAPAPRQTAVVEDDEDELDYFKRLASR